MAVNIHGKLKPKNNGTFALMDACDVELEDGKRLDAKIKSMDVSKAESLAEGVAKANVMYFLGTINDITISFLEVANIGDMVFVSFTTGENPDLTINTDNHVGLEDLVLQANCYYELIGLYNGTVWVFVYHEVIVDG